MERGLAGGKEDVLGRGESKNKDREANIKEAAKQAKAAEKQAKLEAEKAKEAAKQAKKEAKARKNNPLDELKRLAEEAKANQTETL